MQGACEVESLGSARRLLQGENIINTRKAFFFKTFEVVMSEGVNRFLCFERRVAWAQEHRKPLV